MGRCTAPINGHRTVSGRNNCPECGQRSGYGYNSYSNFSDYSRYYSVKNAESSKQSNGGNRTRAKWSSSGSAVLYTPKQIKMLTPIRESVEKRAVLDLKDVFLCHAWEDRKTIAKELTDLLQRKGTSVWFSENEIPLGSNMLREIDKGLKNSRVGIVLVTSSFLKRIQGNGVSDKELSSLLFRDQLIPILVGVTFEELREESPLLGSRNGLTTEEDSLEDIADKVKEVVSV